MRVHVYKKFLALKATGGVRQDSDFVMEVVVEGLSAPCLPWTYSVCVLLSSLPPLWIDRAAVCSTQDFFTPQPQSTMTPLSTSSFFLSATLWLKLTLMLSSHLELIKQVDFYLSDLYSLPVDNAAHKLAMP